MARQANKDSDEREKVKFEIQQPRRQKLIPVTFRLRPVTVGQLRKIAFVNNMSIQELANQMIEHCLEELNGSDASER